MGCLSGVGGLDIGESCRGDTQRASEGWDRQTHLIYQKGSGFVHFLTYEDEQDPDCDLQTEGDADQGDDGGVKGEVWPLIQHGL